MKHVKSVTASDRVIELSKPEKVLFPITGLTKREVAEYYLRISETALPHFVDRPLRMQRFPDGVGESGFFQKDAPDYFPAWIRRHALPKQDGRVAYVVVDSAATMVYLADQGCVTFHLGLARVDAPQHPDRMVFDLDPGDRDFRSVQRVARALSELLDELGLASFPMITGSRACTSSYPWIAAPTSPSCAPSPSRRARSWRHGFPTT